MNTFFKMPKNADVEIPPLPKVGDRITVMPCPCGLVMGEKANPVRSTVVYTNSAHGWYMVRFPWGINECFKAGTRA